MKTDDMTWVVRSGPRTECVVKSKKCQKVGEGGVPQKRKMLEIM